MFAVPAWNCVTAMSKSSTNGDVASCWKLGDPGGAPVAASRADIVPRPPSLAGLPGMSVPAGFDGAMPVGLQLIGNYFAEARLLNAAHAFQQATDIAGHCRRIPPPVSQQPILQNLQ